MDEYSGEDILNIFQQLNVPMLNLNPNVVRAWFDTDDGNLKSLLTWMCTSLSKANYVSPLEQAEYLEIESPLVGEALEREVENIEAQYPGFFDVDMTALEIEMLEDEIELAVEEVEYLDEQIRINENLNNSLAREVNVKTSQEIKTGLELKSMQTSCNSLGAKLDELNEKLYKQLEKYGLNLHDFEFGPVPNFINNIDISECREKFENMASLVMPLLDEELYSVNMNMSIANVPCQTISESTNPNNSVANTLNNMKSRILHSHRNYVVTKIEVEKAREMLSYLNKTDINSILCLEDDAYTQMKREGKEEAKRRVCKVLDDVTEKFAEHHIAQTKLKYAQQEFEGYRAKLESVKKIEDCILKFLSHYIILNMLYNQEKEDIDNSDQFFRKIHHYIRKDLNSCSLRIEKMRKIIHEHQDYNSKNVEERFKLIKTIVGILTNGESCDTQRALEIMCEFKAELDRLENKLFWTDFYDHREMTKELKSNVEILRSFLVCGPTHRIVVVPFELKKVLGQVDEHLKNQVKSVKSAVEISSSMKKVSDKWQNYRRQLWMYFYTDPEKLFLVLQEVEEEFKK